MISGNGVDGILIVEGLLNVIQGNFIGTNVDGTSALGNALYGVDIGGGTSHSFATGQTMIGGSTAGAGNVISGNDQGGIYLVRATLDLVAGNLIGTNATGAAAVPNDGAGIEAQFGGTNTIGGTAVGASNIISGNAGYGVWLYEEGGDLIAGNKIGTDINGTVALGNNGQGILLDDLLTTDNTIGGTATGAGNLISGNTTYGVEILDASDNLVAGNKIGTNFAGTAALSSPGDGVFVYDGSSENTIGGAVSGAGNLISGNDGAGVEISLGNRNFVQGNLIGTDVTGTVALGNGAYGVELNGGATHSFPFPTGRTVVGGSTAGAGNVISGNAGGGIFISGGHLDVVAANLIGTNVAGTVALPNFNYGIYTQVGSANTIGGTAAGSGNVISGNLGDGVSIVGDTDDVLASNKIGTDVTGTSAIGNQGAGVSISGGATGNQVGYEYQLNIISGNTGDGVDISGLGTDDNTVDGNFIGTDITGTVALPNEGSGVSISGLAAGNTIGALYGYADNIISGNAKYGVVIDQGLDNDVFRNLIGAEPNSSVPLGNGETGVRIVGSSALWGLGKTGGNVVGSTGGWTGCCQNVIAGNGGDGVFVYEGHLDMVTANQIGNANSGVAIPNAGAGIEFEDGSDNRIGNPGGGGNGVAGNTGDGIVLLDETGDVVEFNDVGLTGSGWLPVPNGGTGIVVDGGRSDVIGGTRSAGPFGLNVISNNGGNGIFINSGALDFIAGNFIGTNPLGTVAAPNAGAGIVSVRSTGITIGGTASGAGNVISGNDDDGIDISGDMGDLVAGNNIGTDVTGTVAVGNVGAEVNIDSGAIEHDWRHVRGRRQPDLGQRLLWSDHRRAKHRIQRACRQQDRH